MGCLDVLCHTSLTWKKRFHSVRIGVIQNEKEYRVLLNACSGMNCEPMR